MMSIASWPPLTTGIERLFISMALVHTKLRNRLGSDKVAKLVHVGIHTLEWKEEDQEDDHIGGNL